MSLSARLARAERAALCDLLLEVGPDAPTLCAGWTAQDLAAHLVVREGRPDAALGIVVPALAEHGERLRRRAAARPLTDLVATLRTGPPLLSPLRPVDAQANSLEFLIHHEDVRRGSGVWSTRDLGPEVDDWAWRRLAVMSRMLLRSAPVSLRLRWPDAPGGAREVHLPREDTATVVAIGAPLELLLLAHGRTASIVRLEGEAPAVASLRRALGD